MIDQALVVELATEDGFGSITLSQDDYSFEVGSVVLVVEPTVDLDPGEYTVTVTFVNPITQQKEVIIQNLRWGVISFNTDQDQYVVGETAHMAMTMLNHRGEPVCDGELVVSITRPDGLVDDLTSEDQIHRAETCGDLTNEVHADYVAEYSFEKEGVYTFTLNGTNENGEYVDAVFGTLNRTIDVRSDDQTQEYATRVARDMNTRLFPEEEAGVSIAVMFGESYIGQVYDVVPTNFIVSDLSSNGVVNISESGDRQVLVWDVVAEAGDMRTFSYTYNAPDVSPAFYVVGPFQSADGSIVESRVWQIASDNVTSPFGAPDQPQIAANLRLWLDGADPASLFTDTACITPVVGDGDGVQCWQDKSGNDHHVTLGGVNDPTYRVDEFNGNSVVEFVKSNAEFLQNTTPSWVSDYTTFIVFQATNPGALTLNNAFFANSTSASATSSQIDYDGTSAFRFKIGNGPTLFVTDFADASTDLNLYTASVAYDGVNTTTTTYIDSVQANQNVDAGDKGRNFQAYRVNVNRAGGQHTDSKIAEVIVYDKVLDICEVAEVNKYLGVKYGRDFSGIADANYDEFNGTHNVSPTGGGIGLTTAQAVGCISPAQIVYDFNSSGMATVYLDINNTGQTAAAYAVHNGLDIVNEDEFFTMGADSGLEMEIADSTWGGTYDMRIEKTWRADYDDGTGVDGIQDLDFSFNLGGIIDTSTRPVADFAMLIDEDQDGDFFDARAVFPTSVDTVSHVITFEGINMSDGDWFTLATSQAVQLPTTVCDSTGWVINDFSFTDVDIPFVFGDDVTGAFDVNVTLEATHTWVGDLWADVTSPAPASTNVLLFERPGVVGTVPPPFGCGEDNLLVTFDDEAPNATSIENICNISSDPLGNGGPPYAINDTYYAQGGTGTELSVFDGQEPNGVWRVHLEDVVELDVGTLDQVCMDVQVGALTFEEWVSEDPTCADELGALAVPEGNDVYRCYEVINSGTEAWIVNPGNLTNDQGHDLSPLEGIYAGNSNQTLVFGPFVAGGAEFPIGTTVSTSSITVNGNSTNFLPTQSLSTNETSNVTVEQYDYGDAPNSYGTLESSGGPLHRLVGTIQIGSEIDVELEGFGDGVDDNMNATDDDVEGSIPDDEDGISSLTRLGSTIQHIPCK